MHATKGIAQFAHRARVLGAKDPAIDRFIIEALFTTVTNVNFDPQRLHEFLIRADKIRNKARRLYESACQDKRQTPENLVGPAAWDPADDLDGLVKQGEQVSILARRDVFGDDIAGLQELLTYGVKGTAAYAQHARVSGA